MRAQTGNGTQGRSGPFGLGVGIFGQKEGGRTGLTEGGSFGQLVRRRAVERELSKEQPGEGWFWLKELIEC